MRFLLFAAVVALSACASNEDVYGGTEDTYGRCQALPNPSDRADCIAKAAAGASSVARQRDIGPPDCHPASTNPSDRNRRKC